MKVNEIFYSIQGEGFHAGTPAVFVRLSKCNLKCPFCDTDFSASKEMTEDEIVCAVNAYNAILVVITGGEPSLQLTHSLVEKLHKEGKKVAVETNGTRALPNNVDWITVSPKESFVGACGKVKLSQANEVKVVFDNEHEISNYGIEAQHYYVQPCDTGDANKNEQITKNCINFIKENPKWKISIQLHKMLNVQ